jgi:hypothetical protein
MNRRLTLALVATALVSTSFRPLAVAQDTAPPAASASTAVPALVPFSGILVENDGKVVSRETSITFLIFKDQAGGESLFAETRTLRPTPTATTKSNLEQPSPAACPRTSSPPARRAGSKCSPPDNLLSPAS